MLNYLQQVILMAVDFHLVAYTSNAPAQSEAISAFTSFALLEEHVFVVAQVRFDRRHLRNASQQNHGGQIHDIDVWLCIPVILREYYSHRLIACLSGSLGSSGGKFACWLLRGGRDTSAMPAW